MRREWLITGILLGALLAGLVTALSWRSSRVRTPEDLSGIPTSGKELGFADAPVLVEVFSDYQCAWCAYSAREFETVIVGEYVASGKARLRFRDYPFVGVESYWSAIAAGCAARQDAFWPYHDRLFGEQKGENQGRFTQSSLKALARELDLDEEAFGRCLAQEEPADEVRADHQRGVELGVSSTPTFLVNGRSIAGVPSLKKFRTIMREELKAKR